MKASLLFELLLITGALHAQQQPGVNCVPVQGNGWQGCAPVNQPQQPQTSQPPPQKWVDHYGAIAADSDKGLVGSSIDANSFQQAEQLALIDCASKGGTICKVQISYRNQCAAMIIGNNGKLFNTNDGSTIDLAVQKGMQMCTQEANDCHVFYSACSLPQRIQ